MNKGIFSLLIYIIIAVIYVMVLSSCARGLTPSQAANGAKCGQYVR
jgi:hypothetical protein